MRYSKKFLNERYHTLPESIQDMMGSVEIGEVISSIEKKHNIDDNHLGIEITYVMVGVEKSSNFICNLKAHLNLSGEKVNAISKDVNEKIFLPMLDVFLFERQA